MGATSSSSPSQTAQCRALAREAGEHAERASEAATEAENAARDAAKAKTDALAAIDSAVPVTRNTGSLLDYWRQPKSGEAGARRSGVEVSAAAAEASARAASAKVQALEAQVRALRATSIAAEVRASEAEATAAPLRQKVASLESRVQRQEYMWFSALALGLVIGACVGGLAGAVSAAMSGGPSIEEQAGTEGNSTVGIDRQAGLVSAVADLSLQVLSLSNVLNAVGGLAITGVYFFLLVLLWSPVTESAENVDEKARVASGLSALLSLGYAGILVLVGDRIWGRGDDGSRILGGLFYTSASTAVPVMAACALRVLGWRWLLGARGLGSPARRSLADFGAGAGPAPALLLIALSGVAATAAMYERTGFPLLMVPALICSYVGFVAAAVASWGCLRLPRWNTVLLEPEVLASLVFGVVALGGAFYGGTASLHDETPSVRLALLVSGMNALLLALPASLLGVLDVLAFERPRLADLTIYDTFELGPRFLAFVSEARGSPAFAGAASVYMIVWIGIMTSALRLHLWTCRPFVLLSVIALCAASPRESYPWALAFRVPMGLWLLAVTVFVENTAESAPDPVLVEVLRWLGPQPAPFLQLLHALLQVSTVSTAMTCLLSGVFCAERHVGEQSWALPLLCWFLGLLALAVRAEARGSLLGLCLVIWALAFFMYGVQSLPRWGSSGARIAVWFLASRLCLLGRSSILIVACCGVLVFFLCMTTAWREGDSVRELRRNLLHSEGLSAEALPLGARLAMSGVVLFQGVAHDEPLLVTLGCSCFYASFASTVVGKGAASWAVVVALCGVVTMFLGEMVQAQLLPIHSALMALAGYVPWCGSLFSGSSSHAVPIDLLLIQKLLHDITAIVSGELRDDA